MARMVGYFLFVYFAFAWQATLRPLLEWQGFSPNFLVLALIALCTLLSDVSALFIAALLGLLSDSLSQQGLGHDVLSYVAFCVALQAACPPKLVRNPIVLLAIVVVATTGVEFIGVTLRATLNHEISWNDPQIGRTVVSWILITVGNGIYTALLAVLPLFVVRLTTAKILKESQDGFANRWHRLTSY